MIELNIAEDFSPMAGPRFRNEGEASAEELRERLLEPKFHQAEATGCKLFVDLDGGYGYPTSFLEEAFGGLARKYSPARVLEVLELKSEDEPYLDDDVRIYVAEANRVTGE